MRTRSRFFTTLNWQTHCQTDCLNLRQSGKIQLLESSVPRLAIAQSEIPGLQIDHRAGFLLSLVNGVTSLGEIQHLCARIEDPAALFAELLERKIVVIDPVDGGPESG